ncbi:MAG: hypothetical protein PHP46_02775, partial [Candidatus Omnitrophica bacterium]|nr:hypothetical protein [Candidatus Omnitrophota bacterium]
MRKLFSAVIILLLAASLAHAAEKAPSIKTSASPDKIFIGDRIHYQVEISSRKDIEVQFPKFAEDKMGDFEIKDLERKDARTFLGVHVITNRYLITTYSTGKKTIPAMEVRYKERGQKEWGDLKTTPIEIDVGSVLPKNTVIADIKGIKGPMSFPDIFFMVMTAFLSVLFIYILFVSLRKFLKKKIPKKLPYETALDELEKTRAASAKSRNIKEYYVAISDITRQYIESTYSLKAPEMTTEEFLQSL